MFTSDEIPNLRRVIAERTSADAKLLQQLRDEIRGVKADVRRIQERTATAVSLVASDGGNNKLVFDPFYVQLVRVVDSYGKQLCLEAISPTMDTDELSAAQFDASGVPKTCLGKMMKDLGVKTLHALSPMIPTGEKIRNDPGSVKPGWVLVYRDMCEWATLYDLVCYSDFGTDTLLVRDGLLRTKIFSGTLLMTWRERVVRAIEDLYKRTKRRVYLVGFAKHAQVLDRYRLAMTLENILPAGDAYYVRVPRELEERAYRWSEFAKGAEAEGEEGEAPKFVAGTMYFARFGTRETDPVWPIDLLTHDAHDPQTVFGYLFSDARQGFPIPFYPRCLQRAHEFAEVVGFDMDILQDAVFDAVRKVLPQSQHGVLDAFRLNADPSGRRYE